MKDKKIVRKWKVRYRAQGRLREWNWKISAHSKAQATATAHKALRRTYGPNGYKIVEVSA